MQKYFAEFIGTFFLVLSVILVANHPSFAAVAPIAIGSMLMVMVYAGVNVSGAHYNPAITLAMLMRGKVDRIDALYYVTAQVFGAILAASIGVFLHDSSGRDSIETLLHENTLAAIVSELLGTFALVYVALQLCAAQSGERKDVYGLALGFTFTAIGYTLGPLSGGAFNPALAIGASIAGMFDWAHFYIYFIGSLLGAAAATTAFQAMDGKAD